MPCSFLRETRFEACLQVVPEDGIVWQVNVGDVEVNELGAVVVALPKGDRRANLPYWNGGTISDS